MNSLGLARMIAHDVRALMINGSDEPREWKWDIRGDLSDILGPGAPAGRFEAMRGNGGIRLRVFAYYPQALAIDAMRTVDEIWLVIEGWRCLCLPVLGTTIFDEHGTFITEL